MVGARVGRVVRVVRTAWAAWVVRVAWAARVVGLSRLLGLIGLLAPPPKSNKHPIDDHAPSLSLEQTSLSLEQSPDRRAGCPSTSTFDSPRGVSRCAHELVLHNPSCLRISGCVAGCPRGPAWGRGRTRERDVRRLAGKRGGWLERGGREREHPPGSLPKENPCS